MFKTRWLTTVLILSIVVIGYGTDVPSASTKGNLRSINIITEKPYSRRYQPLIDAIEKEMRDLDIPGAAVAVVEGGEITLAAGLGSKHPHHDLPMQPSTLFRIGSVTKTLTAIGLLQMIERGFVDMNAPITDYLPDFSFAYDANWAPSITVWNLLTHTSAIADYVEIDTPGFKDDDALSRYYSGPYGQSPYAYLMAPPGRMFNYTNPGYALAGWVTESASGLYYRHYIRENVLTPLKMMRTFFLPEEVIADGDFAYGSALHWETGQPFVVEPNSYDNGWAKPAGWAFSNVFDLSEIVKFLRAGQPDVLTNEMRMAMQEPQIDWEMFLDLLHYGYGLIVQEAGFYHPTASNFYRMRIVSHGGDVHGFSADLYYVPDLDFGFVALTNASYSHLDTSFATALTTLCEMPTPFSIPNFSMTSADYARYPGQYHDPFNAGDILVKLNNNQLTVEIPEFDEVGVLYSSTLVANTPNNFILYLYGLTQFDAYPLQVTFILDDEGRSEYFRTRSFVAEYQGEIPPEPGRPGRTEAFRTMELFNASRLKPVLPEPRLPFIRPPVR
ncbi:MAG: beta-lactamase family protein [Sedimentisphaerales bacterium]|nr:beta-lactamase family protein [Sedimentisphaerales bacterium]